MSLDKKFKKLSTLTILGLFVLTGTYNAIVINADSDLSGSDVKFVKRLDEITGITIPGRNVAASIGWTKLKSAPQKAVKKVRDRFYKRLTKVESQPAPIPESTPSVTEASIQETLDLNLVEVINPTKWKNGLTPSQFTGSVSTNNGEIENLSVSLPNNESISVSFSEMNGNVFNYDLDGEVYSGMMYQVDQNAYMVTLTNGPLSGTQLRFTNNQSDAQLQETQEYLAENNIEPGNFGQEPAENAELNPGALAEADVQMQQEAQEIQKYNLNQTGEI